MEPVLLPRVVLALAAITPQAVTMHEASKLVKMQHVYEVALLPPAAAITTSQADCRAS
jgi:hypothetical protein